MVYSPKSMNVKPSPKPGTTISAKIVEIKEGVISDFVTGEGLARWDDKTQDCINVTAQADDGTKRSTLLTLPEKGDDVPERSKLGKWQSRYGKFPEVDDTISFVANKDGFWDFSI